MIEQGSPGGSKSKESACDTEDLGWEDPLEKEMATCSSILAWRIPGTEKPAGLQSMGSQRVRLDLVTKTTNSNNREACRAGSGRSRLGGNRRGAEPG